MGAFRAALHGVRLPARVGDVRMGVHGVMHLSRGGGFLCRSGLRAFVGVMDGGMQDGGGVGLLLLRCPLKAALGLSVIHSVSGAQCFFFFFV